MTTSQSTDELGDRKRALRLAALSARRAAATADPAGLIDRLAAMAWPEIVAGVWPLPEEIDLRPLLALLCERGHAVVLAETTPRGDPLRFRRWRPGGAMLAGRFGTLHPDGEVAVPQAMLVPLLAFDARCHRLGYGGGYYDRTLAGLPRAAAVGYGWAAQQVAAVPVGPHDVALDAVVTELGIMGQVRA